MAPNGKFYLMFLLLCQYLQSWNHVNSLIAELRKMQHFCKYFLPGSAMHTKSIYTSQDFILQIDMIIILPPEVI